MREKIRFYAFQKLLQLGIISKCGFLLVYVSLELYLAPKHRNEKLVSGSRLETWFVSLRCHRESFAYLIAMRLWWKGSDALARIQQRGVWVCEEDRNLLGSTPTGPSKWEKVAGSVNLSLWHCTQAHFQNRTDGELLQWVRRCWLIVVMLML